MFDHYEGHGEWDFRNEDTKEYTHCFHIYPAMMIPQVARGLIERYGAPDDFLFDPYCGSGTSLVEGRLAGMSVSGTDLNPTARLIAMTKAHNHEVDAMKVAVSRFLVGLEEKFSTIKSYTLYPEPEFVTFERLLDWFPVQSICEVSECLARIEQAPIPARDFLRIALSECLRLISFQRNGEFKLYRIPSDERKDHYIPLFPLLTARLQRNMEGLTAFVSEIDAKTTWEVHDFNTVDVGSDAPLSKPPTLVVTSPPYGDSGTTVAYAQFSWLTNAWLGLDDRAAGALDRALMGGRRETIEPFGFEPIDVALMNIAEEDERRAMEVYHFYKEYRASIHNVGAMMTNGGTVCYVVGNRTVKGQQLPTDLFTAWAFSEVGFDYQTTYVREIPNKRMPSRNSPSNVAGKTVATMHNEYLVVCKKPKSK